MRPAETEGETNSIRYKTPTGSSFKGLSCAPLEEYLRSQPELSDKVLPEFTIYEWDQLIDSSDMNETHWSQLAKDVERVRRSIGSKNGFFFQNYDDYDGFVILHGTDSLAYTASALAFMLENLGKPVVLTGSMLPMCHIHSDARKNVTVSLMVAGFSNVPEVLVVFGSRILRGCRTVKVDCTSTEAFDSPNCHQLGTIGIDINLNKPYVLPHPRGQLEVFGQMQPSSVYAVAITPGLNPFILRHLAASQQRPLGIILELFGTGTAPMNDPSFLEAIEFGLKSGVTIVAVTQCGRGTCSLQTYENGQKLHELGVIEGKDLTLESAFCKLAYLFGKGYTGEYKGGCV